jgi:ABC-type lipoprotein release transport system permease subunit
MLLTYLKLSWKEIARRRRRSFYTLSGIILSSTLLSATAGISISLKNSFARALTNVGADIVIQTHGEPCVWAPVKLPTNLNPIPVDLVEKARKVKGIDKVSSLLIVWAFDGEAGNIHPTVVAGVEPWERELGPLKLSQSEGLGNQLVKGRYLNDLDTYAVVLDYDFAKFLKADTDTGVILGGQEFKVVGIIRIGREARISGAQAFLPLHTVQEMLKRGEVVDTVFVRLKSNANAKKSMQELKDLFGENSSITTSFDFPATVIGLSTFADIFMLGLLILIIIVALGFSFKSISASLSERIKELCIMKALGWQVVSIRLMLLIESISLSLLAAFIGVTIGSFFALSYVNSIKLRLPEALVNYPPCATTVAKIELVAAVSREDTVGVVILTVILMVLFAGIASFLSSGKLNKIECAQGIKGL